MTRAERKNFEAYLRACTDRQVQGVYDKERAAGRRPEIALARLEAARRGIELVTTTQGDQAQR